MNKNKRLTVIILAVPVLLLIPFIAMQFSTEVDWSLFDFILMGGLLLGAGLLLELVIRRVRGRENRIALGAIVLILFLLVWVELAVGIFGSPFAGS